MTKSCNVHTAVLALLFSSGCIDWDSLRESAAPLVPDGGDMNADTAANAQLDPLIEWDFTRLSDGVVTDLAPREPKVSLALAPNRVGAPLIEGKALWLRGNALESTADAAQSVGDAVAASGGALTVEFWLGSTSNADESLFGLGTGFLAGLRDGGLWIEVTTNVGTIEMNYPSLNSLGGNLHHVVFTYRPGLAKLTGYFDGNSVVFGFDSVASNTSRIVFVGPQSEESGSFFIGGAEVANLRVASAAIFARELLEDEIKRRFDIGAPGLQR